MQYLMNNVGDCKDKDYLLFMQENSEEKDIISWFSAIQMFTEGMVLY